MTIHTLDIEKNFKSSLRNALKEIDVPVDSAHLVKQNMYDEPYIMNSMRLISKKYPSQCGKGQKVKLLSCVAQRRKNNEVFSSYPMACNLYRASSIELRTLKMKKQKARKSVLTLPNVQAPLPKSCTVSDNEYISNSINSGTIKSNEVRSKGKSPKKKPRVKERRYKLYNHDSNNYLECISTDYIGTKKFNSNRKRNSQKDKKEISEDMFAPSDVFSVLRNINKFRFRPHTQNVTEGEEYAAKKKKMFKRKFGNANGRGYIETCHTEEIAYVANFEIQSKCSASAASSTHVTVIDKNESQKAEELERTVAKPQASDINAFISKSIDKNKEKRKFHRGIKKTTPPRDNAAKNMNNKCDNMNNLELDVGTVIDANQADSETTIKGSSHDSSNCFRIDENDETIDTAKVTHPSEFRNFGNNKFATCAPKGIKNENYSNFAKREHLLNRHSSLIDNPKPEKEPRALTQVVINYNNNKTKDDESTQVRKPRLVTTMPSGAAMHKLSVADIRKKLANIKFPLVILGKDQVSSTLKIPNYDPPQFHGLDEHIWPFMVEWKKKNIYKKGVSKRGIPSEGINNNFRNENALYKLQKKYSPLLTSYTTPSPATKTFEYKQCKLTDNRSTSPQSKVRPTQYKDKMQLQLLYKKPTIQNQSTGPMGHTAIPLITKKADAFTEVEDERKHDKTQDPLMADEKILSLKACTKIPKKPENILSAINNYRSENTKPPFNLGSRYPWAKAKWTSDFIDKIIQKVNDGAYYGTSKQTLLMDSVNDQNNNTDLDVIKIENFKSTVQIELNEAATATTVDLEQYISKADLMDINNDEYDSVIHIPGFDDALPNLEIKTSNFNEIQVKNRVTNVMVQFDVTVPGKSSCIVPCKKLPSSSCVPLTVSGSHTMVYKYQTTIVNGVLPAELCTVIPKLFVKNVFESSTNSMANSTASSNITLTESGCVVSDIDSNHDWMDTSYDPRVYQQNNDLDVIQKKLMILDCIPSDDTVTWNVPASYSSSSPRNHSLLMPFTIKCNGTFAPQRKSTRLGNKLKSSSLNIKLNSTEHYNLRKVTPQAIIQIIDLTKPLAYKQSKTELIPLQPLTTVPNGCKQLDIYRGPRTTCTGILDCTKLMDRLNFTIDLSFFNHREIITQFCNTSNLGVYDKNKNSKLNMFVKNTDMKMSVTISNVQTQQVDLDSAAQNAVIKSGGYVTPPMIEYSTLKDTEIESNKREPKKQRGYIKLYRKCKSATKRKLNKEHLGTPINKIDNIEKFMKVTGASTASCSVFGASYEKKIFKCLKEMECWTKYITARQAMLILLLSNKQETPKILRYRPVILQGIATNRITRAEELDMEIEVIETENLNLKELDGILYVPASEANQNNLFEELYWIAKTTAADYQRPFDETSELLLKSLFWKRDKLNPSYLRVMARYVGLGLLKTPKSKPFY